MRKRLVLLVVLVMVTLSSCMRADHFLELALCGSYAVPGMFDFDLKGQTSPVVLEEDGQGRILFEFTHQNSITGESGTALVICQHIDADYVYYYEDLCYLYNCTLEEDIAVLKSQNDWGLPLDFGKMSNRPNTISLDLTIVPDRVLKWKDLQKAINTGLAGLNATLVESCLLDINPSGYELFWITAVANEEKTYYYAIIDADYHTAFMPTENPTVVPNEIATFKNNNGWYSKTGSVLCLDNPA